MTEAGLDLSQTQRTAAALLSRAFAYDADVLPIAYDGASLTVAIAAESPELVDKLRQSTRKDVRTVILPVREIREGLKALYPAVAVRDADSQAAQTLDEIVAAAIGNYASDVPRRADRRPRRPRAPRRRRRAAARPDARSGSLRARRLADQSPART